MKKTMKPLPKALDSMLYHLHKQIWHSGEVDTATVEIYDAGIKFSRWLGYNVKPHDDYIDVYKFIAKQEKEKKKNDYQI